MNISDRFNQLAHAVSHQVGHAWTFFAAFAIVVVCGATGPVFNYSNTWQLVINTGTTIITFLMVFLIQATQNRDTIMVNVKLDELLRSVKGARNAIIDLDSLDEGQLDKLVCEYQRIAKQIGPKEGSEGGSVQS